MTNATKGAFNPDTITDQKRFVRGEHWLFARQVLRARDHAHNRAWQVMMLAGPDPWEEIRCIKAVMPKACITAVDVIAENVAVAEAAGASHAIQCDIGEFGKGRKCNGYGGREKSPPDQLIGTRFDAVCLDFTQSASEWTAKVIQVYFRTLAPGGVLMVNFSYGRDVVEAYDQHWLRAHGAQIRSVNRLIDADIPDPAAKRIFFALGRRVAHLRSVLQYKGAAMPMLSCLLVKMPKSVFPLQYINILPDDFELAVTAENIGDIYACPQDRIMALRRTATARKAVATRRARQAERLTAEEAKRQ